MINESDDIVLCCSWRKIPTVVDFGLFIALRSPIFSAHRNTAPARKSNKSKTADRTSTLTNDKNKNKKWQPDGRGRLRALGFSKPTIFHIVTIAALLATVSPGCRNFAPHETKLKTNRHLNAACFSISCQLEAIHSLSG